MVSTLRRYPLQAQDTFLLEDNSMVSGMKAIFDKVLENHLDLWRKNEDA